MNRGRFLAFFIVVFAAASVRATTIDMLRQRLAQLSGAGPVSGRIEVVSESSKSSSKQQKESRAAVAEFDCDATGLRLSVGGRDLADALDAKDSRSSLVDIADVWRRVNAGALLLKKLRKATVIGEQAGTWHGQRGTRVELKIERDAEETPKMVKMKMDETNAIWVAADGTPLAFEQQGKASIRILLLSANATGRSVIEYAVSGDRLIAVRDVEESTSSGMGENGQEKKTTTVTLRK